MLKHTRFIAVASFAGALAATAALDANAAERVRWKMQSAYGSTISHLGPSAKRFVEAIDEMSEGNFQIKFHEPNALVPSLEIFDAVFGPDFTTFQAGQQHRHTEQFRHQCDGRACGEADGRASTRTP